MELKAGRTGSGLPLWLAPFPAAALGTVCGVLTIYVYDVLTVDGLTAPVDLGDAAFFLATYTMAGFFVAVAGLIVIGVPLTLLLRGFAHSPWSILAGAVIGGVAGRLVSGWLKIDIEWSVTAILDSFGFLVGAFTGLFWALLVRKRLMNPPPAAGWG